jgi:hypothetical protein
VDINEANYKKGSKCEGKSTGSAKKDEEKWEKR